MHFICFILTGALGGACVAAGAWAIKGHFRQNGAMPAGMRLTSALNFSGAAWFFWHLAHGLAATWPLAVLLFTGSLLLFGWTVRATRRTPITLAYDKDLPEFLLREGPYRYVRHPFYASYMMFWIGTALAAQTPIAWAAPAVMGVLYFHAATREEQKFAASELREAYAAYRRQAGMFLPWRLG